MLALTLSHTINLFGPVLIAMSLALSVVVLNRFVGTNRLTRALRADTGMAPRAGDDDVPGERVEEQPTRPWNRSDRRDTIPMEEHPTGRWRRPERRSAVPEPIERDNSGERTRAIHRIFLDASDIETLRVDA